MFSSILKLFKKIFKSKKKRDKGMFVALEGIDACGKTTQILKLKERLVQEGFKVYIMHFPQENTPVGDVIYHLLRTHNPAVFERPDLFQSLYALDQYIAQSFIEEKLGEYDIILCDRYLYSTIAFGMANGLTFEGVRYMQKGLRLADLILYLDISSEESAIRRKASDIHEANKEFQTRVRDSYRKQNELFSKFGQAFNGVLINAADSPDIVFDNCYSHIIRVYEGG